MILATGACTPARDGASTTITTVVETDDETTTTSTTAPDAADEAPCRDGSQPFVENGGAGVIERDDSDADTVSGIRWSSHGDCDRVIIEFTALSGAPAVSPPGVGPLFIRPAGVLRLQLDGVVSGSAVLDQVVDGAVTGRAFVVRRSTGELFIDLHLSDPAIVRVSVASSPARIIVDALAGGDPYTAPAIVTDDLVVIDPIGGNVLYPFTINGYVRGSETTMTVSVSTEADPEIHDGDVGAGIDAWGAFTILVPDGPDGVASLIVGDRIPISLDLS